MLFIVFLLLASINCALAQNCTLTLPRTIVNQWRDTNALEAVVATDYQSKVAALDAGYEPIGYYVNNAARPNKRSIELLQNQRHVFMMVPKARLGKERSESVAISYPIAQIEKKQAITLPQPKHYARVLPTEQTPKVTLVNMPYVSSRF